MILIGKGRWPQIDLGGFERPRAVLHFALRVCFCSVIVASLAGFLSLLLLTLTGYLTLPFDEMVRLMVAFAWLFGGILTGGLAFAAGHVIRELAASRSTFERLSKTDTLTGLANRRVFNEAVAAVSGEASLAIIDIDRFKSINDRFGHQVGDRVIQAVSSVLREVFDEPHLVVRLGGEEFGVVLRGGTRQERLALVEEARKCVAARCVDFHGTEICVTISAGVAEFGAGKRPEIVYAWADKALYLAKDSGRDRVIHEQSLVILEPLISDHASDDARLFAAIGRRD